MQSLIIIISLGAPCKLLVYSRFSPFKCSCSLTIKMRYPRKQLRIHIHNNNCIAKFKKAKKILIYKKCDFNRTTQIFCLDLQRKFACPHLQFLQFPLQEHLANEFTCKPLIMVMKISWKKFRFNHICASHGKLKARALPVFHALTGCDTTSAFRGKGQEIYMASIAVLWRPFISIKGKGSARPD